MGFLSKLQRHGHQHEPRLIRSSDAIPFDYTLLRSRRRTLAVYVRGSGVEVRVPQRCSEREIQQFLKTNLAWVARKLEERRVQQAQLLRVEDGASILYKARRLRLRFHEAAGTGRVEPQVILTAQTLEIHGRKLTSAKARKVLENWLLAQAREVLPARTRALAAHLGVGDRLKEVVFRKTRSKWGHCTSTGRIQYNWLIMLAPDAVVDYMICHETCHLVHMNHSAEYWQLVASVCPDYKTYVAWLKRHEHRFWPVD